MHKRLVTISVIGSKIGSPCISLDFRNFLMRKNWLLKLNDLPNHRIWLSLLEFFFETKVLFLWCIVPRITLIRVFNPFYSIPKGKLLREKEILEKKNWYDSAVLVYGGKLSFTFSYTIRIDKHAGSKNSVERKRACFGQKVARHPLLAKVHFSFKRRNVIHMVKGPLIT